MASTYSPLKIELIGTGEQVGTWGQTTNTNLGTAIEESVVGTATVTFSSSNITLTLINTNSTQTARHLRLNLVGTSGGARELILGSGCQINKPYIINNDLADAVTVKNTTGTGVTVPAGRSMWVYNNGVNVVEAVTHLNGTVTGNVTGNITGNASTATALQTSRTIGGVSFDGTANINLPGVNTPGNQNTTGTAANVTGTVAVANGGTGTTSLTANNVLLGNGTSSVQFVAPGASGNILTSDGTTWQSVTPATPLTPPIPAGTVMLFVQTAAPTGWTKDTTNHNNKALRVVTGTASSGGSVAFTSAFTSQSASGTVGSTTATGSVSVSGSVGSTTLTNSEMPFHNHGFPLPTGTSGGLPGLVDSQNSGSSGTPFVTFNGGSAAHSHSFSGSGTFSGTAHTHTFTGSSINLAVQYVDVIIATKN